MGGIFLSVVFGLMGSGKSRRARHLSEKTGAAYISSDITRKQMANVDLKERAESGFGSGIYSRQFTDRVYGEMLNLARVHLERGESVVLDATYSRRSHRDQVRDAAARWNMPVVFFFVDTPESVIRQRLLRRERKKVISDGRLDVFPQHKKSFDPPAEDEGVIRVTGDQGVDAAVSEMVTTLERVLKSARKTTSR